MPYELRTFGGLDLLGSDGEPIEAMLSHSKGMALLVYLAVEAGEDGVPRGRVAPLLWPGRDEERAQNALRVTLTRIRQSTERPLIGGRGESVLRLSPGRVESDVEAFERALDAGDASRALELYRGHFLAGFGLSDAGPFERWVDERRERYRDRAYEAALSAGGAAREAGERETATEAFKRALRLRPLREAGAVGLARTLAERGRTAEALERLGSFERRRREELGLGPSDELEALAAAIRTGEVELASDAPGSASAAEGGDGDEVPSRSDAEAPFAHAEEGAPAGLRDGRTGTRRGTRQTLVAGAVVALAVAAAFVWQAMGSQGGGSAASTDPSVAVLPFQSIGPDSASVGDGLHTDLLTRLSHVSGLDVISGTSVNRFRDAGLPLPAIADSLGARWVLEGTVEPLEDEIQVNVQLIDSETDTHSWAHTYRRELTTANLFDLQGDISERVAEALAARVASEEIGRLRRRPTGSLEAYRFYVRGRGLLEQRKPPEMERSLDYFDQALAVDSSYALAWAGRADALSILARYPGFDPDTLLPPAADAADRALSLEPELAEAHAAQGRLHMYRREGPQALEAFERAIALRPSYAAGHAWLAKLQLSLGRPEAALPSAERAVELDPLSVENLGTLSWAWLAVGEPERALAVGRRATELNNAHEGPSIYERLALSHLPDVEELRSATRAAGLDAGSAVILAARLVETGDSTPAREFLARTEEAENPFLVAWMNAALGEPDSALAVLRRHYPREERVWDPPYTIYLRYFWSGTLGSVRQLEGYRELERVMYETWGLAPDGRLPGTGARSGARG